MPELLLAIKREVDRDTRPGRFLLTGSARLLGLKDPPDALPRRAAPIELWPLSQEAIDSARDGLVAARRLSGGRAPRSRAAPPCALLRFLRHPRRTLSRYLDLLELVFVIKRIPAWSSNLTTRAISTPKLIVTDSGLGGKAHRHVRGTRQGSDSAGRPVA